MVRRNGRPQPREIIVVYDETAPTEQRYVGHGGRVSVSGRTSRDAGDRTRDLMLKRAQEAPCGYK